jgi:chromosome segregation protein
MEVFGFKSFADRSRIEFTPGISALLGPNGCGKSNIVDAIKWVLGEQASRSLRAERMEDVIFNGTETRKPLNVAEVTLTLSNDSGVLPIDMPEIMVKRRLYRSGESEYYINGTPVKLKELRELFYDTGIGKSAYSIMEQGKIDQVLSNKPEERRLIFEEAAGITRYRIKGQEAERKLERTEENMRQVESIISEVKRSHDSLKSQAEKTLKYRTLREKSFTLELEIQLLRLKSFIEQKDRLEEKLAEKVAARDAFRTEIDGINESLEKNLDLVNSMESSLVETQKKLYGIDLEKNGLDGRMRLLQERQSEVEAKIASDAAREKTIREKIAGLLSESETRSAARAELGERIAEVERNIGQFERNIETASNRIQENDAEIALREREAVELEARRETLQNDLRSLTDDIVTQLDRRLAETGYSYRDRKTLEETLFREFESLRILVEGKVKLLEDAAKLSGTGRQDPLPVIESGLGALREAVEKLARVRELLGSYVSSTPAFLDEFLAPEGIITRKREIDEEILSIRDGIAERRRRADELRAENRALRTKIDEYRRTLEELRVSRARMRTQLQAADEALAALARQVKEQETHLADNAREIERGRLRVNEIAASIGEIRTARQALEDDEKRLREELSRLERTISDHNSDLHRKEKSLRDKTAELAKIQGTVEKTQLELAEAKTEIRNIYDNFREKHSRDLSEFEDRMFEISTPTAELRDGLNGVREELKALGSVNLMAPEEYAEVKERYEFLLGQLEDLRRAREDLRRVTEEIRTESSELFLETYNKIKKNFHIMFRRLFGGGRTELRLAEGEDVLEAGVEIYAQPPGKKLENIALLSGGERSLTAVALLFATYMVKPSPFCLLDEIDAALDEQNVNRFVAMLMEFSSTTQFIVITHNKKTVAGAQTLLGVTMEESGVSKIIAIRIDTSKKEQEVGV